MSGVFGLYHRRRPDTQTAGAHRPDHTTPEGGPYCWNETCLHRARLLDTLCPVCADDPATRALWETAMAEADMRRREREDGAA